MMKSAQRAVGLWVLVGSMAACTSNTAKPGIDSTTTTSSTSTTTSTSTVPPTSFGATVFPQMQASNCAASVCHGGFPATDGRRFTNQAEAFTFAVARSIRGNPGGSLFLQKPSGATTHAGGTPWASGSAGFNAATNWINGDLRASIDRPQPDLWAAHRPAAPQLLAWLMWKPSAQPAASIVHE